MNNKQIVYISLQHSKAKNKKYSVYFKFTDKSHKTTNFGDSRYQDFTQHHDEYRKKQYQTRHKNDNLNNRLSAGYWSYFLLWNKNTIEQSIKDIQSDFKVPILNFID